MRTDQPADRLFVALKTEPFQWFADGRKLWELRRTGPRFNSRTVRLGRPVELRRGYSIGESLWGVVEKVQEASGIREFFKDVPFAQVICGEGVLTEDDAVTLACVILRASAGGVPVIGFKLDLTTVDRIPDDGGCR